MKATELCERLLMYHEALCRIGFVTDDIFVSPHVLNPGSGLACWGVVLKTQGKEWSAAISPCEVSDEAMSVAWQAYIEESKNLSIEELGALWDKYMPISQFVDIIMSLGAKGFEMPNVEEATRYSGGQDPQ